MKLAIAGKGGVGKTTITAGLALRWAQRQKRVMVVDHDPDGNLATALGIPADLQASIVPIARQRALIEERTGAKVRQYGQMFKLNPQVADIVATHAVEHRGVALLTLGAIETGGGGCACPENVLIRALITDLILFKDEAVIMDMEAGIEHLGRATARGVDALMVVVEPGQRSLDSLHRIQRLAIDIDIRSIICVANKIESPGDEAFVRAGLAGMPLAGIIPLSQEIRATDRPDHAVLDGLSDHLVARFDAILDYLESRTAS